MEEFRYDKEKKRVKLGLDGKGKYMGHDKKLYSVHHGVETYEYIPKVDWEREVTSNPNGLTATRAKESKDTDINKIKLPVVYIEHDKEAPNKTLNQPLPEGTKVIEQQRTINFKPTNTKEHSERKGYISAEEGKGFKKYKLPMLEEDEK